MYILLFINLLFILFYYFFFTDKQQELDLPSLRTEDVPPKSIDAKSGSKKKKAVAPDHGGAPQMSHIQGVKRPLCHANSFTGEKLPKYGVETRFEDELGEVSSKKL